MMRIYIRPQVPYHDECEREWLRRQGRKLPPSDLQLEAGARYAAAGDWSTSRRRRALGDRVSVSVYSRYGHTCTLIDVLESREARA